MILVDTSVWIDHLRRGVSELQRVLDENAVLVHPLHLVKSHTSYTSSTHLN